MGDPFLWVTLFSIFSQDELSSIKKQILQGFSPDDDAYLLGAPLFMETPRPCSPLAQMEFQAFDEVIIILSQCSHFRNLIIHLCITKFSYHRRVM